MWWWDGCVHVYNSVPEALALYVIKQLATRTGVRVMEVHKISWPNNVRAEFLRMYFWISFGL